MKAAPFNYVRPSTLIEALQYLAGDTDAKLLAGGQSLLPMMNFRFAQPDVLVDISRLAELDGITDDKEQIVIGAGTRQATLLEDAGIAEKLPLIPAALRYVGHIQTRSRGTIGGSMCHLDPAAELPLLALLYNAEFTLRSAAGERRVAAKEWCKGYLMANCAPSEILVDIRFPRFTTQPGEAFEEFARRHGDFAIVSCGALLVGDGTQITDARIAFGGVSEVPLRAFEVEAALVGARYDNAPDMADAAARAISATDDAYYSAAYRQHLAGVLARRAVTSALRGMPETGGTLESLVASPGLLGRIMGRGR